MEPHSEGVLNFERDTTYQELPKMYFSIAALWSRGQDTDPVIQTSAVQAHSDREVRVVVLELP